jgi:hypothetical protein
MAPGEMRQVIHIDENGGKQWHWVGPDCFVKAMGQPLRVVRINAPASTPALRGRPSGHAWDILAVRHRASISGHGQDLPRFSRWPVSPPVVNIPPTASGRHVSQCGVARALP